MVVSHPRRTRNDLGHCQGSVDENVKVTLSTALPGTMSQRLYGSALTRQSCQLPVLGSLPSGAWATPSTTASETKGAPGFEPRNC